ncbi:MAG TPA: SOS response-associated peptidase family protein [Pseudolabrys sp.]|nr:SOS response-associated peptidase family protein [Pseudolabrys sp.]
MRFGLLRAVLRRLVFYRLTVPASNLEPRYNLEPTTTIDAVISRDGKRELARMRWGLCPSWLKKTLKEVREPRSGVLNAGASITIAIRGDGAKLERK